MMHAGCVFVAGIRPSRTGMSGSFESVRWNACMHRLDLGLYSHPTEILGNGVMGTTRGVTVSMSAFLACHQCYCAGSSLAWGLNLRAVVYGIFRSSSPGVFCGSSGFLPSFIG